MAWCVMVKGPCRGKSCDFWVRVKLRKKSVKDIVADMREKGMYLPKKGKTLDGMTKEYLLAFGIKDTGLLRNEEPDLWSKVREALAELSKEREMAGQ